MKLQLTDREALMAAKGPKEIFQNEYSYHQRMMREHWRFRGLDISKVCRCERATPCFDHIVYLSDLRTAAQDMLDKGDPASVRQASDMFLDATNFYLKLTEKGTDQP